MNDIIEQFKIEEEVYNCLNEYEKTHYQIELFNRSLDYYTSRIKMLDFTNKERVLDAGCGMGQWAIAISDLNKYVEGIDIHSTRLLSGKSIAQSMNRKNICFQYSATEELPFQNDTFDLIFCYGVFMFTDMKKTLKEFYRVLRPGGRVYINSNTYGWYVHMLVDRGLRKRNLREIRNALKLILRGLAGSQRNAMTSHGTLVRRFEKTGFKLMQDALEGCLVVNKAVARAEPIYKSYHYGLPAIREYLLEKPVI